MDYGKKVTQGRRDLRPGHQVARSKRTTNGLYVEMSWEEPFAGRLTETYHVEGDKLYVESGIAVKEGSASSVVVRLPMTVSSQLCIDACILPMMQCLVTKA